MAITYNWSVEDLHRKTNNDAVFGVKDSLISEYVLINDKQKANELDFKSPFYELEFNFVLEKN